MKRYIYLLLITSLCSCANDSSKEDIPAERPAYALVIHGGAGTITRANLTPEREKEYKNALNHALDVGENILQSGGDAIDAVQAVINTMEDSPLFNAGKGAVFTNAGTNEMDASIMEGFNHNAGAVGTVSIIKNPINAARAVMEQSEHVFMTGKGAEEFAVQQGLQIVDPYYFHTDRQYNAFLRIKDKVQGESKKADREINKRGTVGCVALDSKGNIVAGTSTGGMTNKKFGRVGDSPIIGAGTYADNKTCGVSATGHGEYFIRYTVARDIAALMEYGDKSLEEAAKFIINDKLLEKGGSGGVIALDHLGNIVMPFNTEGMYRGWAKDGRRAVLIYRD